MSNLTGTQIQNTYGGVINIGPSGATGSLQTLTDGLGTNLPLQISTSGVNFTGSVSGTNIKNLEVTAADITYDGYNSNVNVVFATPMPSTSYTIFFTYSLAPNDILTIEGIWGSGSYPINLYYYNKTNSGFSVVFPGVDLTPYPQFLGYVNCSLIQEI